jgi:hypothetical protein
MISNKKIAMKRMRTSFNKLLKINKIIIKKKKGQIQSTNKLKGCSYIFKEMARKSRWGKEKKREEKWLSAPNHSKCWHTRHLI